MHHFNPKIKEIGLEPDELRDENIFKSNKNYESLNITESSNQNLSDSSSKDSLDDQAVKRPRYGIEKVEKSIADFLQAVQSKCHIIYTILLLAFVFKFGEFAFKYCTNSLIDLFLMNCLTKDS